MSRIDSTENASNQDGVGREDEASGFVIQASEKMQFIKSLYRDKDLTDATVRIGVLLVDHCHSDLGVAFTGFGYIHEQTGKSTATITKAVEQLVAHGWFTIGKGAITGRKRYPRNLYAPNWDRRHGASDPTNVVAFPAKKARNARRIASENEVIENELTSNSEAKLTSNSEVGITSLSEVYTVNAETVNYKTDKEGNAFTPPPASPAAPSRKREGAGERTRSASPKTGKGSKAAHKPNPRNWPDNAYERFMAAYPVPDSEIFSRDCFVPRDFAKAKRRFEFMQQEGKHRFLDILYGVECYAQFVSDECKEPQFVQRPFNFLMDERWLDYLEEDEDD